MLNLLQLDLPESQLQHPVLRVNHEIQIPLTYAATQINVRHIQDL